MSQKNDFNGINYYNKYQQFYYYLVECSNVTIVVLRAKINKLVVLSAYL